MQGEKDGRRNTLTLLLNLPPVFCQGGSLTKPNKKPEGEGTLGCGHTCECPETQSHMEKAEEQTSILTSAQVGTLFPFPCLPIEFGGL
jgi:hypothetical protein